jgi:2-iminobutanoate/2-iminopropanoate deaminase
MIHRMSRTAITSSDAPQPIGPYSPAVLVRAPAGFLFCSGQTPLDPATGRLVEGGVTVQTERVLDNLHAVLEAAGMTFANVVKTTVFLTDMGDFEAMNAAYRNRFAGVLPARSTVQVAGLPRGARVEIELTAAA